jgi:hypothetical protein
MEWRSEPGDSEIMQQRAVSTAAAVLRGGDAQ